jgi:tetratricopeptide (TPR) repeat protein
MATRAFLLAVFLALFCWASPTRAQGNEAKRSVEKADAGLQLYERNEWQPALESFQEAEKLYHSPVYLLYTARCLQKLGRWMEAKREYERLLAEQLTKKEPDTWRAAHDDARRDLDALIRELPSVHVEVLGATSTTRVTVDDESIPLGRDVPLDPGQHRIVAVDGVRRANQSVKLEPGQKSVRVVLRFAELLANKPVAPKERAKVSSKGPNVPGLVLTAAGGAALIAGGIVGFIALDKAKDAKDDLPESCVGTTCPTSQKGAVEDRTANARRFATISDGLFIGGGALVTAGVLFLILDPGDAPKKTARTSPALLRF